MGFILEQDLDDHEDLICSKEKGSISPIDSGPQFKKVSYVFV